MSFNIKHQDLTSIPDGHISFNSFLLSKNWNSMKALALILTSAGSAISIGFGVWHFFVHKIWSCYNFIDKSATELIRFASEVNLLNNIRTHPVVEHLKQVRAAGSSVIATKAMVIWYLKKDQKMFHGLVI